MRYTVTPTEREGLWTCRSEEDLLMKMQLQGIMLWSVGVMERHFIAKEAEYGGECQIIVSVKSMKFIIRKGQCGEIDF